MDLISKSFTKHCTNRLFCIIGLLKLLPRFLLDGDAQVREAAANPISTMARLKIGLVGQQEPGTEQGHNSSHGQDAGSSSSSATTPIPPRSPPHLQFMFLVFGNTVKNCRLPCPLDEPSFLDRRLPAKGPCRVCQLEASIFRDIINPAPISCRADGPPWFLGILSCCPNKGHSRHPR